MDIVKNVFQLVVKGNEKAIVGFLLAAVAGLGLQVGGTNLLDATVGEVVSSVATGAITAAGVWFKANS